MHIFKVINEQYISTLGQITSLVELKIIGERKKIIIENSKIEEFGTSNQSIKKYDGTLQALPLPEAKQLRIVDGAKNWSSKVMDEIPSENITKEMLENCPGIGNELVAPIFSDVIDEAWTLLQHGLAKGSALILGLAHHHDGDDLVITSGWPAVLEAFGFSLDGNKIIKIANSDEMFNLKIEQLREAKLVLDEENHRKSELEKVRATNRIAAETDARQKGLNIAETDKIGKEAAESIPDQGPKDKEKYLAAQIHEDDYSVDGIIAQIRKISSLRWEHSAPIRVGSRMGRPEKSAPRIMNPMAHILFPIELNGGNQRLMSVASQKKDIRTQLGSRTCTKCQKKSPFITCHHRKKDRYGEGLPGEVCGGRTEFNTELAQNRRRRGELMTVPIESALEDARIRLGIDRLPKTIKCMKKINCF